MPNQSTSAAAVAADATFQDNVQVSFTAPEFYPAAATPATSSGLQGGAGDEVVAATTAGYALPGLTRGLHTDDNGGNERRWATIIVYLNTVPAGCGGETVFAPLDPTSIRDARALSAAGFSSTSAAIDVELVGGGELSIQEAGPRAGLFYQIRTPVLVYLCVYACVRLCLCVFVNFLIRAFVHLCICAFVHIYICVFVFFMTLYIWVFFTSRVFRIGRVSYQHS
jgi:hypothetical protein